MISNLLISSLVVKRIELSCFSRRLAVNFTTCRLNFIFSHLLGYAYDPDCMYINGSGRDYYEFYIQLNRCGTLGKNSLHEDSRKNPTVS